MATYPVYSDEPINGNLIFNAGKLVAESAQDNITALASGSSTSNTPLVNELNRITTAAAGSAVSLPPSRPGLTIIIVNHGANSVQVFGALGSADTIDDQAYATGVAQMASSTVLYTCHSAGAWYTEGLASGFALALGLQTYSYNTIAANVGGTQGTGTAVTSMLNNITAAGASYSVTLPASAPGLEITLHNISANTVLVFPNAGGTTTEKINALSANASYSMATNTSTVMTCVVAGQWYSVPRVAS